LTVGAPPVGEIHTFDDPRGLERPDGGAVILDGRDITKLDEDALARFRGENIGIVFQSFQLIPTMTGA